MSVSFK